jgi:hypothetical protein
MPITIVMPINAVMLRSTPDSQRPVKTAVVESSEQPRMMIGAVAVFGYPSYQRTRNDTPPVAAAPAEEAPAAPVTEAPAPAPAVEAPAAPVAEAPAPAPVVEAPAAPVVAPAPANPLKTPASKPVAPTVAAAPSTAVFPSAISPTYANEKPYKARLKTCSDQYKANKAVNANGGLKWIQKGGGYWRECNKHLQG